MKAWDFIKVVLDAYNESPGKEVSIKGRIPDCDFPKLVHYESDDSTADPLEHRIRNFEIYECDDMPVCVENTVILVPHHYIEVLSFDAYLLESKVTTFVLKNEIIKRTRYSALDPLKHPWVFALDTHHPKQ